MQRYHDVISSFGGKTSYDADNRPLLVMRSNLWAFFFYGYGAHRDLHSFPTRRSSDLGRGGERLQPGGGGFGEVQCHHEVIVEHGGDAIAGLELLVGVGEADQYAAGVALDGLDGDAGVTQGALDALQLAVVDGGVAAGAADLHCRVFGVEIGQRVDEAGGEDDQYQQILP